MRPHVLEGSDPRVLGRRLQAARKARHLTQQEVAKSLELARTTIIALEQGKRRIRPNELIQLARLYGGSVSQLVGPREFREDFSVQFRAAVAGAETRQAQEELEQAIQSFQGLCEDYRHLERLDGASIARSYPSQYAIDGVSPEVAAEDVASSERNRLGIGDGPILNLRGDPRRPTLEFVSSTPSYLPVWRACSPIRNSWAGASRSTPGIRRNAGDGRWPMSTDTS